MASKAEMMGELRQMLRDVFAQRASGASYAKLSRAHGFVDGYMRSLLDSGMATQRELLDLVSAERATVSGPATRDVRIDSETEAPSQSVAA